MSVEVKAKKSSASKTNGSSNGDSAIKTLQKSIKKAVKKPIDEYEMDTSYEVVTRVTQLMSSVSQPDGSNLSTCRLKGSEKHHR